MALKNEKWLELAEIVDEQNRQPELACIRKYMRLSHMLGKYLEASLRGYGINRTQMRLLLHILANKAPLTPTELSKLSLLTIDAVNKSVDRLDKAGITRSYRSRTDRRVRKVTLTDKGLEILENAQAVRQQQFADIVGCLDAEELDQFSHYLGRVVQNLNVLMTSESKDQ